MAAVKLSKLYPFKDVIGIQKIIYTEGGKSLYDFIYMYLLGAYMRRYHIFKRHEEETKSKWDKPIIYLIAFIVFGLINVLLIYIYPDKNILTIAGYNDNPMVVLQCIVLFRFFERIDLRKHVKVGKVINVISAGNLGIYMIHEHALIRNLIWKDIFHIGEMEFYQRPYWALDLVLIIFAVYGTCLLIDYIRKLLWIPVTKILKL